MDTRERISHRLAQIRARFVTGKSAYRDEFTTVLDELSRLADGLPAAPVPIVAAASQPSQPEAPSLTWTCQDCGTTVSETWPAKITPQTPALT